MPLAAATPELLQFQGGNLESSQTTSNFPCGNRRIRCSVAR